MSSGPTIELGELRHEPESQALPRPPRGAGRPLRCALVLLLVLAGLAASAPVQSRSAVVVVPARLGAEAFVAGDLFVLVEPTVEQGRQRRLAAYRLPGGEPAWQAPLPVNGRFWMVTALAETLLVNGYGATSDGAANVTTVVDRATGALRWQQPDGAVELADGNLLLASGDWDRAGTLRAVDRCCGTVRWRADVEPGEVNLRFTEARADRIVHNNAAGRVEVRDATTGAVLVTKDLWGPADGRPQSVQVVGDLLLTIGGTPPVVNAYGLDRLERRWRTPVDQALYAMDCGRVICLQTRSGGLRTLDAATGRPGWTDDRWASVTPSHGQLIASAQSSAGPGTEDLSLLDATTGRVIGELGRWDLARPAHLDDPVIGLRRHPDGGLLVAELDLSTGTVRPLDVLTDAAGDCQTGGDRLICRRPDGSYGLWQLHR
ncbi:PQQ-binding-like beta-propeller repeat protein [Micromonospora sp. NPDC094482]|uniref:outer membrane protein assembly factor BamB family protein n=1 Tax=unclassified Micromonospora TaxID=2617518 RepID=UPI003316DC13